MTPEAFLLLFWFFPFPPIHRFSDFFEHLLQGMRAGDDIPVNETRTDKDSLEAQTILMTVEIFVR